ncbi:folate family ECF transporter S component [Thermoanaerobacterium thermosaccharolyticum]|uniref:folate family ECF transporter S component n=1 Tax=Thermoanaerobacterium thermosaccharolyticum TaxID=1517 RepID=UPI003DA7D47B
MFNEKIHTRELVFLASLISLNIVLSRIASIKIAIGSIESIRIGFGALPVILSGIMFGPIAGGIVGSIGDIVGYYINPLGPYMPHFTLTAALTGIIPPLILKPIKAPIPSLWQLLIAIGVGQFISSVILVSYFLQILFKIPIVTTLPSKVIGEVINVPIYALFTQMLLKKINMIYFKAR